ncbi:MAG: hypothetical protein N4A50_01470 [Vallitalea sp.]|jgi:hypothetical protein|nr:hypothetical protein [Vallitalea sp.]
MVGTKYHLDFNTGMISYNGNTTNNYISDSSRWAINYHYNLAEMKQLNIDAKNKLEQLLVDRGAGDYKSKMQKAYNSMHFLGNVQDGGAIADFFMSVSTKAYERYNLSSLRVNINNTCINTIVVKYIL